MSHFLAAVPAYPDNQFIPFLGNFQVSRDITSHPEHFPDNHLIAILHFGNTLNRFLRNNQDVYRSDRMDVMKRQNCLILVHNVGRNLFADDFGKNRFCHSGETELDVEGYVGFQNLFHCVHQLFLGDGFLSTGHHILHDGRLIERFLLSDDDGHFDTEAIGHTHL